MTIEEKEKQIRDIQAKAFNKIRALNRDVQKEIEAIEDTEVIEPESSVMPGQVYSDGSISILIVDVLEGFVDSYEAWCRERLFTGVVIDSKDVAPYISNRFKSTSRSVISGRLKEGKFKLAGYFNSRLGLVNFSE